MGRRNRIRLTRKQAEQRDPDLAEKRSLVRKHRNIKQSARLKNKKVKGIPEEVTRRLFDLEDNWHLEPEGRAWLRKVIKVMGLEGTSVPVGGSSKTPRQRSASSSTR